MEWIYVKDQMPTPDRVGINSGDKFCQVIIHSNWGGTQVGVYYEGKGFVCPDFDWKFRGDKSSLRDFYDNITHWMYLPEKPPFICADGQQDLLL